MNFQIILRGDYHTDQEFEEIVRSWILAGDVDFAICEARSLEGLKEETWKRKPKAEDLI